MYQEVTKALKINGAVDDWGVSQAFEMGKDDAGCRTSPMPSSQQRNRVLNWHMRTAASYLAITTIVVLGLAQPVAAEGPRRIVAIDEAETANGSLEELAVRILVDGVEDLAVTIRTLRPDMVAAAGARSSSFRLVNDAAPSEVSPTEGRLVRFTVPQPESLADGIYVKLVEIEVALRGGKSIQSKGYIYFEIQGGGFTRMTADQYSERTALRDSRGRLMVSPGPFRAPSQPQNAEQLESGDTGVVSNSEEGIK